MVFEAMMRPDAPHLDDTDRGQLRRWMREVLTLPAVRTRWRSSRPPTTSPATAPAPRPNGSPPRSAGGAPAARAPGRRRPLRGEQDERAGRYYAAHRRGWGEFDEAAALRLVSRLRHLVDGRAAQHNTTARRLITANEMFDWGRQPSAHPADGQPRSACWTKGTGPRPASRSDRWSCAPSWISAS